ncbi:MAG: hypothetical protein AAF628_20475 [Planctomycetota bacterium]
MRHVLTRCFSAFAVPSVVFGIFCCPEALGTSAARSPDPDGPTGPCQFVLNEGQWEPDVRFRHQQGLRFAWFHEDGWTVATFDRAEAMHRALVGHRSKRDGPSTPPRGALHAVRMRFESPTGSVCLGEGRATRQKSFLLGRNPTKWRSAVTERERLRYPELYPGVDVVVWSLAEGLEYDLELEPGADPDQIALRCEGSTRLQLDAGGALRVHVGSLSFAQQPPVAWFVNDAGERSPVSCEFRLLDEQRFGFAVARSEPSQKLIIDPQIVWSVGFGGSSLDQGAAVHRDHAAGRTYVAGDTVSVDFPVTPGVVQNQSLGIDAFVAAFDIAGNQVFTTYVGGSGTDRAFGLHVAPGAYTLVGSTDSSDLPLSPGPNVPYDADYGGSGDAFVIKLTLDGQWISAGTYLGGSPTGCPVVFCGNNQISCGATGTDWATAVDVGSDGKVAIVGTTTSPDFEVNGWWTYQCSTSGVRMDGCSYSGGQDAFVCQLSSDLSTLQYSAYFGGGRVHSTTISGPPDDIAHDVSVSPNGFITFAGETTCYPCEESIGSAFGDFPVRRSRLGSNTVQAGEYDAFVAQLDPSEINPANQLQFSDFLGGGGFDHAYAVDASASEQLIFVAGASELPQMGPALPTINAPQGTNRSCACLGNAMMRCPPIGQEPLGGTVPYDGFLTRILLLPGQNANLLCSTLLGGWAQDIIWGLDVFVAGNPAIQVVTVVGETNSTAAAATGMGDPAPAAMCGSATTAFPTTANALQSVHGDWLDGFITRYLMVPDNCSLLYSSFLGGNNDDVATGVDVDPTTLEVFAGGWTASPNFSFTATYGATQFLSAFVARHNTF